MFYAEAFSTKVTPQSEPIPGQKQVRNNAGGFVYEINDWGRLNRFLIIGSDGNTYYQSARKLTKENADAVIRCIIEDGARVVARTVEVSADGLAPKNDPAIFVLAMASVLGNEATRRVALDSVPLVCRTGTHLFQFAECRQSFGGWGRGMRRAIRNWYDSKPVDRVAYQLAKYQSRNGWSHRDLLRLSHPKTKDESRNAAYRWAVGKPSEYPLPQIIADLEEAKTAAKPRLIQLIEGGLTREMVPTEHLSDPDIQWALMQKQGLTALIRNLGNYSKSRLLKPLSKAEKFVVDRLSDSAELQKSLIHPFSVLLATKTYAAGHGYKSVGEWTIAPKVVDALNAAFYASFKNVEPTGKRYLLGIDVSGSMDWDINNSPITAREAAGAMAMMTLKTEPECYAHGFSHRFVDLALSPSMRLDSVLQRMSETPMGRTDCAVPMLWAKQERVEVDAFVVYTDNETWAGNIHPKQALDDYRQSTGINAKLIVCGFTSTGFSIADPNDSGMLDCVGLDASLPQIISGFAAGRI